MTVTFVSVPDFFNADVADLRGLGTWQPGDPNSINDKWRRAIDVCLDEVEFEEPRAVFVAGDLVEGWWDHDDGGHQLFGPTGTNAQTLNAIDNAADAYYGFYKSLFSQRGLPLFPALGDHEIGDDRLTSEPVDNRWPPNTLRYDAIPTYKQAFGRAFPMTGCDHPEGGAADTAYAKQFNGNVLLVSVDMFTVETGGVDLGVEHQQLAWLDNLLAANTIPNVIVQGHVPVITPVHTKYSGGLHVSNGKQSAFWQCLRDHGVPLFLCGEVHDITAISDPGGPVQISHGSLFHRGFNYLVIRVDDAGGIELESKQVTQTEFDDTERLYGVAANKRPARDIAYARGSNLIGTMSLDPDGTVLARSGSLDVATDLGHTT